MAIENIYVIQTMNWPATSNFSDKATLDRRILTAIATASFEQLGTIQCDHLFGAQRQRRRLLCIVHIMTGAGNNMNASVTGHLDQKW